MGETNSPSVAHVDYDIPALSRVKFNPRATEGESTFPYEIETYIKVREYRSDNRT